MHRSNVNELSEISAIISHRPDRRQYREVGPDKNEESGQLRVIPVMASILLKIQLLSKYCLFCVVITST